MCFPVGFTESILVGNAHMVFTIHYLLLDHIYMRGKLRRIKRNSYELLTSGNNHGVTKN